jgi:signal transduction histidine kinase
MEIPEFVSNHLSFPPPKFTTANVAEVSLCILFYLSINKDRIEDIKNLSQNDNSIEILINDFHETAKKNPLLEDIFFEYIIGKYDNSETDKFIFWLLCKYLDLHSSKPNIDFVLDFNTLLDFLLEDDKGFYKTLYLTDQDYSLLFDEDLQNYLSSCKTVYFPSLRTGRDITQLEEFGLSKNCLIVGNEPIYKVYLMAKMNLIINGFTNLDIKQKSAFDDFPFSYLGKVDFVFSFGFFGKKEDKNTNLLIEKVYKNDEKKIDFLNEYPDTDILMLDFALQLANNKGKIVAVLNSSFLYFETEEYRKFLIKNNLINKVARRSIDEHTPFSNQILLDKNKNHVLGNSIIFIKEGKTVVLDNDFLETTLSPFRLSNNDYNFLFSIYFKPLLSELIKQLKNSSNLSIIKNVVSSIKRGGYIPPNKQTFENQENYNRYIRVGDLSKNINGNYLDLNKVNTYVKKSKKSIDYSCVLVSLLDTNLNSTCFNYEGQAISIGSDIFAIQLNQDIKLEYFAYQLKTRLVQIQAEMLAHGTVISRIDKDDFLNIQFILPSLEEQEKQLFEIRNVLANQAIAQKEVDEILNQSKYSDYQLIASVAHSFKNKISPILLDYKTLKNFLDKQEILNLNESVRPVFEGETAEDVDTFRNIVDRIEKQLATLPKIFNDVKILQKQELDTKQENITDFIKNVISNYKNIDYKIKIIPSKKPLFVLLDSEAFRSVIENLIDNAKNHAFKSMDNKENCKIEFEIKKVEEKINGVGGEYAQIIYKDNGKGFPKGYTFESYKLFGNKSIQSDGTGIGGFIISKIVELHGGTINLLSTNSDDEFTTQISILLPLS